MYKYNTIATEDDFALIQGLVDKENKIIKDWIWIEFKVKDKEYPDQNIVWDNPYWIFGEFYQFLLGWVNKDLRKEDKETFADIWEHLTDDIVGELLEIVEEAKKEWYEKI